MGHRGAPSLAPENTLAGFRSAFAAGASWTETDVSLLGDGTPVIFHDSTLDRCTDRSGSIETLNADDLQRVCANRQFPDSACVTIPTLAEALALFSELGMGVNLELKRHDHVPAARLVEAVVPVLRDSGFAREQIMLSSFDIDVLGAVKQALPDYARAVIAEDFSDEVLSVARALDATHLNLWWEPLTRTQTERALSAGFTVKVWTINDPVAAASMQTWGITGFMSDCPQSLAAVLKA